MNLLEALKSKKVEKPVVEKKTKEKIKGGIDTDITLNRYTKDFRCAFHPDAGTAWHTLGALEMKPETAEDMVNAIDLNFNVEVVPRYMPSVKEPGKFLKTDGYVAVAVTPEGKQWELNSDITETWSSFGYLDVFTPPKELEDKLIPWGITSFDRGARAAIQFRIAEIGNKGIEDGVAWLLTVMGSLDGSHAQKAFSGAVTIVCGNTWLHALHSGENHGKALRRHAAAESQLADWKKNYATALADTKKFKELSNRMREKKLTDENKNRILELIFGKSTDDIDNLTQRGQTRLTNKIEGFYEHLAEQPATADLQVNTVWGWLQGYTSYALRKKATTIHGTTGGLDKKIVESRSRFDSILNTDTNTDPVFQYLYSLAS